jgi:phosphotransferase system HPr (HPr) family protein
MGASLDRVAHEARGGLAGKIAHLGDTGDAPEVTASGEQPAGGEETIRLTVRALHGLHARPAARFVQTASSFDARVTIRDLTNGRGPADAASLNGVAMLGATQGHEVEVAASGPQASQALAAIHALAERDFDDRPEPNAARAPQASLASPDVAGVVRVTRLARIAIRPARRFRTPDLHDPPGAGSGVDAGSVPRSTPRSRTSGTRSSVSESTSPGWRARTRPRSSTPTCCS